jgi:hypothetical protein
MNEDIVIVVSFFVTVIVLVLGIPIVRAIVRRSEQRRELSGPDTASEARLARIETAVESMAIEIERISEGQRFTTKLLSDRVGAPAALPQAHEEER